MTTYPDLTSPAVARAEDLLETARADLAASLTRSRARPLPASPAAGAEPASAGHLLAALAPAGQRGSGAPAAVPADETPIHETPIHETPIHQLGVHQLGVHQLEIHELGVAALLGAFASGTTTPSEALAALARRWGSDGPAPGAVLAPVAGAGEAAAESDRRWREGDARALEGVPFAVKDIIDVAGEPVTCGSALTGDRVATTDAEVVARLRAVGAIPVVMTATTEFACGAPRTARYGAVTNPWDTSRWTGGSSTGSAAALAARLVPLALGTDTGGSIRVPAALCGLTGLKPTYGLIPRTGVAALSWTLDHVGPMARDAIDLALVLAHLVGPDGVDPSAGPSSGADALRRELETEDYPGELRPLAGLRVGLPQGWFTDLCDAAVIAAARAAAGVLAELGAELVPVAAGDVAEMHDDVFTLLTCELASSQEANLDRFELFDTGTQVRIARGLVPSAVDYLRALRRRSPAQAATLDLWDAAGVDVVLTPGVGSTAARLEDATVEVDGVRHPLANVLNRNTAVFDYLGFPALMMPAGLAGGLPVGVQVVARPWREATCLRVAAAFQRATSHHLDAPGAVAGER